MSREASYRRRDPARQSAPLDRKRRTPLSASPGRLDALGAGECNHAYDYSNFFERNPFEHPEQAFRRGMQQGAHRVVHALEEAGVLDAYTLKRLQRYYGVELAWWRFGLGRYRPYRLGRRLRRDDAPWLDLKRRGR
jgi:hypothetical protein